MLFESTFIVLYTLPLFFAKADKNYFNQNDVENLHLISCMHTVKSLGGQKLVK